MTPCTTLVQGIAHLGDPMPGYQPKRSKTEMKNQRLKDEDYSKPHQPCTLEVVLKRPKKESDYIDPNDLQITDDALPASRCAPLHKYHATFERMNVGQSLRCTTGNVGKVAGAMRKYIEIKGLTKTAMVRTVMRYTDPKTKIEDVGHGRVWMTAAPAAALKRAA
jgi:hypothetical protein